MPKLLLFLPQVSANTFLEVVLGRTHVGIEPLLKTQRSQFPDSDIDVLLNRDYQNVDALHALRLELFSLYHFNISATAFCE
jgi:hypothetical protein